MGKRNNKVKKIISTAISPPIEDAPPDDDLMDDLLAQLDAKDSQVRQESAAVVNEVVANNSNSVDLTEGKTKEKRDPKSRWRARQVRALQVIGAS